MYHALLDKDFHHAVALLFLVDRYTFWTGTCKAALSVLSYIEKECPNVPVPPQIVIRKARVLKNDGNIQGISQVFLPQLMAGLKQRSLEFFQSTGKQKLKPGGLRGNGKASCQPAVSLPFKHQSQITINSNNYILTCQTTYIM